MALNERLLPPGSRRLWRSSGILSAARACSVSPRRPGQCGAGRGGRADRLGWLLPRRGLRLLVDVVSSPATGVDLCTRGVLHMHCMRSVYAVGLRSPAGWKVAVAAAGRLP
eukprot:scaffold77134_cov63-Phaeocystis_antarctica.AAC.5